MNVTYIKDRSFLKARLDKCEELLGYNLGEILVAELASELPRYIESNPLEGLDMDEGMRTQIRETY